MAMFLKEPYKVKTRKTHVCQGCGIRIESKSYCISSSVALDGEGIWTFYECESCYDYVKSECIKCSDFNMCIGENYYRGLIKDCKEQNLKTNK